MRLRTRAYFYRPETEHSWGETKRWRRGVRINDGSIWVSILIVWRRRRDRREIGTRGREKTRARRTSDVESVLRVDRESDYGSSLYNAAVIRRELQGLTGWIKARDEACLFLEGGGTRQRLQWIRERKLGAGRVAGKPDISRIIESDTRCTGSRIAGNSIA